MTSGAKLDHRKQPRRLLVIWNPRAGRKAGLPTNLSDEDDLCRALDAAGIHAEIFEGTSEAAARRRVREAVAAGYDVVAAAGGDGTANLVSGELIRTPTALGILPLGSAMNLARSLGIPRDLTASAQILATGQVAAVDVGRARDGYFYEMASVGINAAVLAEAHKLAEGDHQSITGLIRTVIDYRPATMTIELERETISTGALMAVVANAPFTGAGLTLAPDARLDDGLLDVVVYGHFSKTELIRHALSILAGRRSYSPKVRTFRSRTVRISARRHLPVRADARNLGPTPLEVEVLPGALRVVVPRRADRAAPADGGPALTS